MERRVVVEVDFVWPKGRRCSSCNRLSDGHSRDFPLVRVFGFGPSYEVAGVKLQDDEPNKRIGLSRYSATSAGGARKGDLRWPTLYTEHATIAFGPEAIMPSGAATTLARIGIWQALLIYRSKRDSND